MGILCLLIITGCGTITTKANNYKHYKGPFSGTIYSTKNAVTVPFRAAKEKKASHLGDLVLLLDTAFSVVADIFCIPFLDIRRAAEKHD